MVGGTRKGSRSGRQERSSLAGGSAGSGGGAWRGQGRPPGGAPRRAGGAIWVRELALGERARGSPTHLGESDAAGTEGHICGRGATAAAGALRGGRARHLGPREGAAPRAAGPGRGRRPQLDRRGGVGPGRLAARSGRRGRGTGAWTARLKERAGVRKGLGPWKEQTRGRGTRAKEEDATDSLLLRVPSAGQLYLVSDPRGAARRGGGWEDWGRVRKPEPENFLLPPTSRGWRRSLEAGGEGGSEAETVQEGLIGAGRGCWAGPPTRPLVAGGATGTRENARRRLRVTRPPPGPRAVRKGSGGWLWS